MLSMRNWQTSGHYKGFLSWRHYYRTIKNFFNGNNQKQYKNQIFLPTSLLYEEVKKLPRPLVIPKETKSFFSVILDTVYSIPWNNIFKFVGVVGGVPLLIVIAYTSIIFIIDKDKLVREEMQELNKKYTQDLEESYILNKAKLDQLQDRLFELEERVTMYIYKIPVYYKQPKTVHAEVMNKSKIKVIEIQQK